MAVQAVDSSGRFLILFPFSIVHTRVHGIVRTVSMQQTNPDRLFQLPVQHVHVYGGDCVHGQSGWERADAEGSREQVPTDAGAYEIDHLSGGRFAAT